jgi:hypothetical protein
MPGHCHINGIKVFLTPEASAQVGFRIDRSLKLIAQGTQKTEKTLTDFGWNSQFFFD